MSVPPLISDIRLPGGAFRVVACGDFAATATAGYFSQAFRSLGWDVEEVPITDFVLRSRTRPHRLVNRVLRTHAIDAYNDEIVRRANDLDADILMCTKGVHLKRRTLQSLREKGVFTIIYYPDVSFDHNGLEPRFEQDFDLFITSKEFHLARLSQSLPQHSIAVVRQGYKPGVHHPALYDVDEQAMLYDICYIGNANSYKAAWLSELAERLHHLRFFVAGNGWRPFVGGTALEPFLHAGAPSGDFLSRIMQHSRISLGLHWGQAGSEGWEDSVSGRSFEIPACKSFMLHIDNPVIRELYNVPDEIDVFEDMDTLENKILHYLDRPEQRRVMAEAAHRRCAPSYSYFTRGIEIAELIKQRISLGGDQ